MSKLKVFLRIVVVSLAMFFQLQFIKFFFVDRCVDNGGRFLFDELMCEGEKGFVSFNLTPMFYVLTCIVFAVVALGMLKLMERLTKKL